MRNISGNLPLLSAIFCKAMSSSQQPVPLDEEKFDFGSVISSSDEEEESEATIDEIVNEFKDKKNSIGSEEKSEGGYTFKKCSSRYGI